MSRVLERSRSGFTLLEVVVALLVLEVAVVGLVGSLVLASATLTRAESLERAVATAEGVLDSLAGAAATLADSIPHAGRGTVRWSIDDSGYVRLQATEGRGSVVLDLAAVVRAAP
jgi:type II secretory pathway pseudopilin PulG